MLQAGDRVGVAVSGGPDSVALLHALRQLRSELGILLGVVHFNHRLRGAESDADQEFTRRLAGSLDLDFVLDSAEVSQAPGNLEQAGRLARYEFFRRLTAEMRFHKIAVGHTRTDQAETVLFRFLRGAATAGLAGIYPTMEGGIVRPLIEVERAEVIEFLQAGGFAWRQDSSNQNLALSRNRLRHSLLPQLEKDWNPRLASNLAHLADWARDEEEYWRAEIPLLAGRCLRLKGRVVYLDAPGVAALPPALERRLLRHAVGLVRGDLRQIEFEHIEQIRGLTAQPEGHGRVQIPGLDAFRSFGQLRLGPAEDRKGLENRNFSLRLEIPGQLAVEQTESRFVFALRPAGSQNPVYNRGLALLDWERTPRPLWLRNWRPGDRYRPAGSLTQEKLKTLFQSRRVPLWERRHWPVVASEDQVVWSRGFGPAANLVAGPETRTVLEIDEREKDSDGTSASV